MEKVPDYTHIADLNNELLSTLQILQNAFATSEEVTDYQKTLAARAIALSESIKSAL